uniref:COS1.4 n=1 Tax=Ciona intestinalis TaxID=7719 RepID=Q94427_CIOIN|nr:COS1.4 [Ciona intestinalis]
MGNVEFGSAHAAVKIHQHPEPAPVNVQPLVTIDQLFDKALENAQCYTEDQSAEYAKWYIERHANTVWVVGPHGGGKTTLLKMMVNQILKHELLPDTEYIFFIYAKDIDFNKEMTLLEFLTTNSRVKVNYTEEESKALITFLHNNPNVAIFFDGLDEASLKELVGGYSICKLDEKSKPVDIMKNLFNLALLPKAKIVVTSTPDEMFNLQHCYRPTSIFEVLGFLEEAKNNLGTQLCGEKYPAIKKILDQQPNLAHLCYLPINFILIVFCLLSNEGSDIKTMTQVLIFSMTRFVESSHLKGEVPLDKVGAEMVKLACLAYKGLQQRKLVFEKTDFDDVKLADEMVTNFFHTYVDISSGIRIKILEGNKRSYFTHHIWQEFYAAVYLMLFVSYREFEQLKTIFEDTQWSVVVKFMFGICNPHAYKQLKIIFPATMIKDYEEKKKFLESMVMESLSSAKSEDLIRRFGWLHEYNDDETSKKFKDCLPVGLKMGVPKHLPEVKDLVYALKSFTKPHKLRLRSNWTTTTEVLETLLRGIHGTTTTITRFVINNIEMKDSLMELLLLHLDAMEKLRFDDVTNLSSYMESLSNAINQRSNKIQLDLWIHQQLNDDDVVYLAGCLGNISRLNMSHTYISSDQCRVLKQAIEQLPSIQVHQLYPDILSTYLNVMRPIIRFDFNTSVYFVHDQQFESSSKCWIGSRGGKLEVGGCELVVPPGALEKDVEIKLTASLSLESEFLETPTLQCELASLTLKKQVTIKLQTHVVLDKETIRRCKVTLVYTRVTTTVHWGKGWLNHTDICSIIDNIINKILDELKLNAFKLLMWKVIFIITILQDGVYEPSCEVYLNSLLYQNAGAVVWKVCWNLDLATRENELQEHHFTQETWTIPLSNDLILCLEKHETEAEVINIIPSGKIIPANQLNNSYCCNKKFKVVKQCTNEVHLIAKAKCGTFRWDDDLWFPLTITQKQQQPVQRNIQIGNVTGPATIVAGVNQTNAALLSSDVNQQQTTSQ